MCVNSRGKNLCPCCPDSKALYLICPNPRRGGPSSGSDNSTAMLRNTGSSLRRCWILRISGSSSKRPHGVEHESQCLNNNNNMKKNRVLGHVIR